jgi:3-oxoacyl-[acyl-carrier-protein] synthase III
VSNGSSTIYNSARSLVGVAITGVGSAAPAALVSNHQLSEIMDTSDEWIQSRTGIQTRHLADQQQSLTDIAVPAARSALEMAAVSPLEVDLIILATSTPDDLFGSAAQVQVRLGAVNAVAFDLTAACSGFVFGLVTAAQYIRTGAYRTVLLIGADVLSRWVDWSDRGTCVLFGDGAGAIVLQANSLDRLLGFEMRSDGTQNQCLNLSYSGQSQTLLPGVQISQGNFQPLTMNGQEVYRFAVKRVPEVIEKTLFRSGITAEQVDWLLLHQANQRILDAVADRLGIPTAKVISNLQEYGNTSAASIPLALDPHVRQGQVKPGHILAVSGFGAGLTWGAAVFQWGR